MPQKVREIEKKIICISSEQGYGIGSFKRAGCLRMFYIITVDFNKPWKVGEDIKRIVDSS